MVVRRSSSCGRDRSGEDKAPPTPDVVGEDAVATGAPRLRSRRHRGHDGSQGTGRLPRVGRPAHRRHQGPFGRPGNSRYLTALIVILGLDPAEFKGLARGDDPPVPGDRLRPIELDRVDPAHRVRRGARPWCGVRGPVARRGRPSLKESGTPPAVGSGSGRRTATRWSATTRLSSLRIILADPAGPHVSRRGDLIPDTMSPGTSA